MLIKNTITGEIFEGALDFELVGVDGYPLIEVGTQSPEYVAEQILAKKKEITREYKDLFRELDISYCGKVARGSSTSQAYTTARNTLQSELVTKLSEV